MFDVRILFHSSFERMLGSILCRFALQPRPELSIIMHLTFLYGTLPICSCLPNQKGWYTVNAITLSLISNATSSAGISYLHQYGRPPERYSLLHDFVQMQTGTQCSNICLFNLPDHESSIYVAETLIHVVFVILCTSS